MMSALIDWFLDIPAVRARIRERLERAGWRPPASQNLAGGPGPWP